MGRTLAVICLLTTLAGCGESHFYRMATVAAADPCRLAFRDNPITLEAWVAEPFSVTLTDLLACNPSVPLTWTLSGLKPEWLTFDGPGNRMYGTPGEFDILTITFQLTVTNGETGVIADVTLRVRARPRWSQDPIQLGRHPQEQPFVFDLKPYVSDPLGRPLTLSAENLPGWLTLGSDGVLTGTPHAGDAAIYDSLRFTAVDPDGHAVSTGGYLEIYSTQPVWRSNPIDLGTQTAGQPFTLDLKTLASDPFARPLVFSATGLPAWLSLTPDGILSGTPDGGDAGAYFGIEFSATAPDNAVARANAFGNVQAICAAPPAAQAPLIVGAFAGETRTFNLADVKYLPLYGGRTLSFGNETVLDWATLSADGQLTISPRPEDAGLHLYYIHVGSPTIYSVVQILVAHDASDQTGPTWFQSPISVSAIADRDLAVCLGCGVFEPNGLAMTITKVNGPAWLTVSPQGTLSGHAPACQQGTVTVEVEASNGFFQRRDTIEVTVTPLAPCTP